MEREWKIGRVINLLNNPTFMFTGPSIRSEVKKQFVGACGEDGVVCGVVGCKMYDVMCTSTDPCMHTHNL